MGYKQTTPHRFGKGSYHQVGLVRGELVWPHTYGNFSKDRG